MFIIGNPLPALLVIHIHLYT